MHANAVDVCHEILSHFPEIKQIWTYNTTPDHNNCRCVDYMVYDDRGLGNRIADYIIANADRLGVNWFIWWGRIWRREANTHGPAGWGDYSGPNPHKDHVHLEVEDKTYQPPSPNPHPYTWYVVNVHPGNTLQGLRADGTTRFERPRGFKIKVVQLVSKWGRVNAVSNYGTYYALAYLKKGQTL